MYFISPTDPPNYFPPVNLASPDGIVAFGGDLRFERLLYAYQNSIFPWYSEDEPILWFSPNPRFVLFTDEFKYSKSIRPILNKKVFKVTLNTAFENVIENCKSISRNGQDGTWITDAMKAAYVDLHQKKYAHSVEVWQNDVLVGGLYGVLIGNTYCGESMFSKVSNASKVGFINFVKYLKNVGVQMVDCQIHTRYLESFGSKFISRQEYTHLLKKGAENDISSRMNNEEFTSFLS